MEQRKTNKKKLVVALALLALIVVASVITTVVLVLAAGQQNVGSQIEVTYSVSDVAATVKGTYYSPYEQEVSGSAGATNVVAYGWRNMKENDDTVNDGIISIIETDTDAESMTPESVALSSSNNYVVYAYEFTNNNDIGFLLDLTYTDDADPADNNVEVYYYVGTAAKTTANFETLADVNLVNTSAGQVANDRSAALQATGFTAVSGTSYFTDYSCDAQNTPYYVYVLVRIANPGKAATFDGSFNFNLTAIPQNNA